MIGFTWQQFFWKHPEWWVSLLGYAAWGSMLLHGIAHAGHELQHTGNFLQEWASWTAMVLAMTLPFLIGNVRFTAFHGLWSRRHRAMLGFLVGYLSLWAVLGLPVAAARIMPWSHTYLLVSACLAAAAAWQFSWSYRPIMMKCRSPYPIALTGMGADRSCMTYGLRTAWASVRSCGLLMLACAFAGHGLLILGGCMAVEYLNLFMPRYQRAYRPFALTSGLAVLFLVLAFVPFSEHAIHHVPR